MLLWEAFPSFCLLVYTHLRSHLSGINAFLKDTVRNCEKNGYVQTLMGRRRYLPGITNTNAHVKAHVNAPPTHPPLTTFWTLSITRLFFPTSGRAAGGEHDRAGISGRHCEAGHCQHPEKTQTDVSCSSAVPPAPSPRSLLVPPSGRRNIYLFIPMVIL